MKIKLHWKIIIGMIAGIMWGILSLISDWPSELTEFYIKPFGDIFISLLKMIAVPLVFTSLVVGISNLKDIKKLSNLGGKTILFYTVTTLIAITIGLMTVNVLQPGKGLPVEIKNELINNYGEQANKHITNAAKVKETGPLKPLVDMFPSNIWAAASDNSKMLQVVFFAMIVGIALISIDRVHAKTLSSFFESFNQVLLKIVEYIMAYAPYGVFALIGTLVVQMHSLALLNELVKYSYTVLIGLLILMLVVYPLILKIFSHVNIVDFFKGIRPAQLMAFSTSSSSATLPVTMKNVENNVGVPEEVSSFVLPVGSTINMDGTSLYQAIAAVFIANTFGIDLNISQQLGILLTALLASVGAAGVPGAGIVMLAVVLEAEGIPQEGIALILATDRILDMCRTVINVTGDAMVATVLGKKKGRSDKNFKNKKRRKRFKKSKL